ncbi:dihydrolipoamide acetyltransferase family protein [Tissierella creatinophila]|uniref:Dihydrolipoamide acetyltransferase component of pyruvate dehydrogenase complex n=1 Tax=Tissierella creatinophila DSM 6911 TaxID=1123403 RepID=A0A1U7M2J3_TISCR|nr:dihydrolipoamide acetyltransferase family protein [Tissierella creatinophila]OLS01506.1 dihydrolipoyllysine-residue acetyltransferase component of pyruvate dehydrogenase complex [Tissierella creatinophila DSM 6911]
MRFEFKFPDVGEGIHEGTIVKWLVEKGEEIKEGDSLIEVETDKVTTDIPSPKSGKVLELLGDEGEIIHVGNVFVVLDIEGEASSEDVENLSAAGGGTKDSFDEADKEKKLDEKEEVIEEETAGVVGEVVVSSEEIPPSDEGVISRKSTEEKLSKKALATPVARAMAKDLGLDINSVEGTGPGGRVMKEDIQKAKDSSKEKSQEKIQEKPEIKREAKPLQLDEASEGEGLYERVPLTRIRKTIAQKMSESKFTIPHTTVMDEINVTELDKFRKKYKDILREEGVNLTYLPFIIKASITAIKELREFNSSLDEVNEEMVYKNFYNIGIATDTQRGLMVPVIRDADKKSIVEIAKEIVDLSTRAKDNKLELSELQGGTFTITNYGSIGGHFGIPIINHPESAILGLGRIIKKPIVDENDNIVVGKMLPISLSYDHRIIDGASGSRFVNILKELLIDPDMLFLKS